MPVSYTHLDVYKRQARALKAGYKIGYCATAQVYHSHNYTSVSYTHLLNGWITKDEVLKTYELVKKNQYGQYLKDVLDGKYREQLY